MSFRRQLAWSSAMHDLSRERVSPTAANALFTASLQRARALDARRIVQSRPLVVNGTYDRSAIMSAAIAEARVQRSRDASPSWPQLLAFALRLTWSRAKAQWAKDCHS